MPVPRPLFARRHFETIAKAVREANAKAAAGRLETARSVGGSRFVRRPPFTKAHAEALADTLERGGLAYRAPGLDPDRSNPYFDRARFLAACGFGEWKAKRRPRTAPYDPSAPRRSPYP